MKFGMIGTNWICDNFMAGALNCPDFELAALYSRKEETGRAFADKYGVKQVFTDVDEMCEKGGIDAVYIASPTYMHVKHAITCMKHKKPVLCEKSMASNMKEFNMMRDCARQEGVFIMEAMRSKYIPNMKVIEDNLEKLGAVRMVNFSYGNYSSRYDAYKRGEILNAFNPDLSNGSLIDMGVYCLNPLVSLFGEPVDISARAVKLPGSIDGCGAVIAQYESMIAIVMHTKISGQKGQSEIQGEKYTMVIDSISSPQKVELIDAKTDERTDISVPQQYPDMYYEARYFMDNAPNGFSEDVLKYSEMTIKVLDEARRRTGIIYPADMD